MAQILTKNFKKLEKVVRVVNVERSDIESKITKIIIQLQISPIHSIRILELFNNTRKTKTFHGNSNKALLAVCFYRVNLEEKLYIPLKKIKSLLDIRTRGFLSAQLRLYNKFCGVLSLKPIQFSLDDHVSNICSDIGLGKEIENKAINLAKMINKYFLLPGENRTCAISSIYFAANFEGELLSVSQLALFFELMSASVLYKKIKIFEKYIKEYFRKKAQKMKLSKREKYFLDNFTSHDRDSFFCKFKSVKN